ncbi:MAG TPA: hypothetical protein DCG24_08400 [Bacteroidetes bacterium]|nr:hypothetical protein [Myxococcales bacterium]MCB0796770.1 hypothetical protein [Chitinophagales bacterium]HAE14241.1 hypothetical protein [Bacteroidota bacterium]HAE35036.1 hypothetical protein [Bacteroidota bacterium]HQU38946.1 hypothetical protein [Chitinophagales bacterium]
MVLPFCESHGLKLTASSFEECWINPEKHKILAKSQQLKDWVEFQPHPKKFPSHVTNEQVIRYIIAMYDAGSPFLLVKDFNIRKACAGEYAAFKLDEDNMTFSEVVQEILNGEWDVVSQMIVQYCKLSKGVTYSTYVTLYRNYHEKTLADPRIKAKAIKEDFEALAEYERKVLAEDQSPEIRRELFRLVAEDELISRSYRPEYKAEEYYLKYGHVALKAEVKNAEEEAGV